MYLLRHVTQEQQIQNADKISDKINLSFSTSSNFIKLLNLVDQIL